MTSNSVGKAVFSALLCVGGYIIAVWGADSQQAGVIGALWGITVAGLILIAEFGLRKLSSRTIVGGILGAILGLTLAYLLTQSLLFPITQLSPVRYYIRISITGIFFVVGLMVGVKRIHQMNVTSLRQFFSGTPASPSKDYKILDTSVIIDGRIADIAETGFLEGVLIIPQFILKELQHIADSSDPIKRNRGRRGLEILHKIQKRVDIQVEIDDRDFPTGDRLSR